MQEGAPEEAPAETPAVSFTPPPPAEVAPPPQPEGFDITRYSLTITLFLVFVVAKGLVYLDIIDV